jgi:hypothetical protein
VETLLETGRHLIAPANCDSAFEARVVLYGSLEAESRVAFVHWREEKIDDWMTKFLA